MVRTSLLTAIGAMLGVALATLGRNTAFALVVVFGWITVVEGMIRGLQAGLARFLWGENMTIVLAWAQLDNVGFRARPGARARSRWRSTSSVFVAARHVGLFRRRDVARRVVMQDPEDPCRDRDRDLGVRHRPGPHARLRHVRLHRHADARSSVSAC